jgi:O-antigen/teichoic acid export membrane protein
MPPKRADSAVVPAFDETLNAGTTESPKPRRRFHAAALRNFGWMMLDKALAVVFGLAVFGLIARWFGTVATGHLAYALALLQSALGLSMVCSAAALLPRLYRTRDGVAGTLANVFVVRMVGSVIAATGAALFALVVIDDPERLKTTLVILAAVPLIEPFYTAVVYWQSRNDNRRPTLIRAAGLMTRAAVVLAAIFLGAPVWIVAFAWLLEACVSAVLLYASVRPLSTFRNYVRRVSRRRSFAYARFGIRFLFGLWLAGLFTRLDRLVLGGLLPAHDFGVYASAMQLVDVWVQVAYLTGFAVGPAFLYKALSAGDTWQLLRVAAMLAGLGCVGLLGALLFGDLAVRIVYGPEFIAGAQYLVAGTAYGVLVFADVVMQMRVTAGNRPLALTFKWAAACLGAIAVIKVTYPTLGAFAGPAGLAVGILCGWIAVWVALRISPDDPNKRALA